MEKKFWIPFSFVKGISTDKLLSLIRHFGSPFMFLKTGQSTIKNSLPGINNKFLTKIFDSVNEIDPDLEVIKLEKIGADYVTVDDDLYPENLKTIHDPPLVLYYKGNIQPSDNESIAMVGARNASQYGRNVAEKFAGELGKLGITIVSGLARGIDTMAHKGALHSGGRTIGVLGCGIDNIYPKENRELYQSIEKNGAVISEFPIGTLPVPSNFPLRNRIIAGMTLGTIVVEAGLKSGSLITANLALESGREVFAVPGEITSELSKGTHLMLKEGAKLVENIRDILEELKLKHLIEKIQDNRIDSSLSETEKIILECIFHEAKPAEIIIDETGMEPNKIITCLTFMELKGLIVKNQKNCYSRK